MRIVQDACIVLSGWLMVSGGLLILFMLYQPVGYSYPPELDAAARQIEAYLLAMDTPVLIGSEYLGGREERHLLDVKRIFQHVFWLTAASGLLFNSLFWWQAERRLYWVRVIGQIGLSVWFMVAIAWCIPGFRQGFVWLHTWLFLPDTWWFASNSTLIQIFSLQYFQMFVLSYWLAAIVLFTVFYAGARLISRSRCS